MLRIKIPRLISATGILVIKGLLVVEIYCPSPKDEVNWIN
jgi:hypothetical protein